jgi:hypothetical protein
MLQKSNFLSLSVLVASLAALVRGQTPTASNSFCLVGSTYTAGAGVECKSGEIFLRGQFVEVGIHNVGSYGTNGAAPSGSAYAGRRLGFIADFDMNGWSNYAGSCTPFCARFAGDYFVPGSPVEGT